MESNITINIVEPGSTPVVPDTGLFTSGIGGTAATILGISLIALLAIAAIYIYIYIYRKHKHASLLAQIKTTFKSKKRVSVSLSVLAFLVSIGTVAGLIKLGANAIDGEAPADEAEETAEATDGELTIELGSEPVFAYVKSTVTVTEDMPAGYTLKAYSANPTLSAEGTDKTISIVPPANTTTGMSALTDNTWGLSVEEPTSQADEIYFSLPATAEEAITIATVEDMEAEGSDTVTVYYGVYVTPDMPYGTYTGAVVSYEVEPNRAGLVTVTFDSNGLYFDENISKTTNIVRYEKAVTDKTTLYSHTPNVNDEGVQDGLYPLDSNKTFVYTFNNAETVHVDFVKIGSDGTCGPDMNDYFTFWSGSHADYTAKANYTEAVKAFGNTTGQYVFANYASQSNLETDIEGNAVTIGYTTSSNRNFSCGNPNHGYGYYATITATDADGNPAYAIGNVLYTGNYKTPATTEYANYEFLGWSTDPGATSASFTDGDDVAMNLALGEGESTTLYAVWSPIVDISYDGNNATAGSMQSTSYDSDEPTTITLAHEDVIVGNIINLYAPNYKKTGYGFAGWSTDANAWDDLTDNDESNDPTIYGPNQTFTMTKDMALAAEDGDTTLYAVWVPAAQFNGAPVTLQNWTGCSAMAATTYNDGVLTVGKNTITALTDSRDGNVYTVARLADGNCWTTENLRLDNSPELTTQNTNNPSLPLTNYYNYENTTTDSDTGEQLPTPVKSNYLSTNSNNWMNDECWNYGDMYCYDFSNLNTFNTNLGGEGAIASYNGNYYSEKAFQWYSYGNNYNWYSATAGQGTYSTGWDEEQGTNIYEDTLGDICPTGWHLPYGGDGDGSEGQSKGNTKGGFYYLNMQMGGNTSSTGSNNWRSFPNNFVYSGYWFGSSAYNRGYVGGYWSSTADGTSNAYYLGLHSGYVSPGTSSNSKGSGYSVRCVAPVE